MMKKTNRRGEKGLGRLAFLAAILLFLTACQGGSEDIRAPQDTKSSEDIVSEENENGGNGEDASEARGDDVDVDLTKMSSTMVYSEVYNMMTSPQDYVGKMVRMNGQFGVYEDDMTGNIYYSVVISDAMACCSQGMEFVLAGDYDYPEDYPQIGEELTVRGVFRIYEEQGVLYCHLSDAFIESAQ